MKKNDLIRQKALEILISEPKGIRLAHLSKRVNEFFPSVKIRTIRWAIWDLDKTHPENVCKPSNGFFIHKKFKKANGNDIQLPEVKLPETKNEEFYDSIIDWINKQYKEQTNIDWKQCPIHVEKVKDRSAFPAYLVRFFICIPTIIETEKFNDNLTAKDGNPNGQFRKRWGVMKRKLAISTMIPGLDFKKWTKDVRDNVFSVRMADNWRVHIRRDEKTGIWYATDFGTRKEMGHG